MKHSQQVLTAALSYLERGWSVLPCVGKRPAVQSWASLQVKRPPMSHLHEWHKRGLLSNVGVICGTVSDNLVVIDLDGVDAVNEFQRVFPHLRKTRQVASGSGKGMHFYFRCQELPPTTRKSDTPFGGFELRADGCYVVAPPSIHPETHMPYYAMTRQPVMEVERLDEVVEFIRSFQKDKAPKAQPTQPQPKNIQWRRPGWLTPEELYFDSALDGEWKRIVQATEGSRNDNLNKAAYNLGKLISAGLDRQKVESMLLAASLAVGLGELESRRTIASGLEAGIRKSRAVPKVERQDG